MASKFYCTLMDFSSCSQLLNEKIELWFVCALQCPQTHRTSTLPWIDRRIVALGTDRWWSMVTSLHVKVCHQTPIIMDIMICGSQWILVLRCLSSESVSAPSLRMSVGSQLFFECVGFCVQAWTSQVFQ